MNTCRRLRQLLPRSILGSGLLLLSTPLHLRQDQIQLGTHLALAPLRRPHALRYLGHLPAARSGAPHL